RTLETGNIAGIREYMTHTQDAGCHTMNSSLEHLLSSHKISVEDARNATTDRLGFADMV
ncbi:MAG: twitching motility protein, partial [Massilia sp.]|nr:twitching motility protein [Massilia sp.]